MKHFVLYEIVLYFLAMCLHVFSFCTIHKTRDDLVFTETQRLYLMNLSAVEFTLSIVYITDRTLKGYFDLPKTRFVLHIVKDGFLCVWYILVMALVTIDRFLAVYLNLRYSLLWSPKKAKISIAVAFCMALGVTTILNCFVADITEFNMRKAYSVVNMPPVLDILFSVLTCLTYGYLFHRIRKYRGNVKPYRQSTISSSTSSAIDIKQTNIKKIKRKFYLSTLLIVTFVLFWMVPNGIHYQYYKDSKAIPFRFHFFVDLLYPIALISDAFIYIFSLPSIRRQISRFYREKVLQFR